MPFRNQEAGEKRGHDDMRQQAPKLPHAHRDDDRASLQRNPPHQSARSVAASLRSSSTEIRSLPQNGSPSTMKNGEPNTPLRIASSFSNTSLSLVACSCMPDITMLRGVDRKST